MTTMAVARFQAPTPPAPLVARPQVLARLDDAVHANLTAVVAGPGFGKTTTLAAWADARGCGWVTLDAADSELSAMIAALTAALRLHVPDLDADVWGLAEHLVGPGGDDAERAESCAGRIAAAVADAAARPVVLVIDGLDDLERGAPGLQVLAALGRSGAPALRLVIASRTPLPWMVDRLRGRGLLSEIGPTTLRFDAAATSALVAAITGSDDPEIAATVHAATGGWPAAVRLSAQALCDVAADDRRTLARQLPSGAGLLDFVTAEVVSSQGRGARELLELTATLPCFDADLAARLGVEGAATAIDSLVGAGLATTEPAADGSDPLVRCTTVLRDAVAHRHPLDGTRHRIVRQTAAAWLVERGRPGDAVELALRSGDAELVAALLEKVAPTLLAGGRTTTLCRAAEVVAPAARSPAVEQALGQALMVSGRWEESLGCLSRAASADDDQPVTVAWRLGLIHHLRGDLTAAAEAFASANPGADDDPAEVALLAAMTASTAWLRGEAPTARAAAGEAITVARGCADANALSAAHTVLAMIAKSDEDRRAADLHDRLALEHAQAANNLLSEVRIRSNRGSHLVDTGRWVLAEAELDRAIDLAELTGFTSFVGIARGNRGNARRWLGRLDEAEADHAAAVRILDTLGSDLVAYPLLGLAELHRLRGETAAARRLAEQVRGRVERTGDRQAGRLATVTLAGTLARDDPERARTLLDEVLRQPLAPASAWIAHGWAMVALGDIERAAGSADRASERAGAARDPAGAVDARELRGVAARDSGALRQAAREWAELGATIRADGALSAVARIDGDAAAAAVAARALARHGVDTLDGLPAGALDEPTAAGASGVAVRLLGGFGVDVDGAPVPTSAWGSRKARDLVKVLAAHLGTAVPREVLAELLWPDVDLVRATRSLSATMSVARGVLDPHRVHRPHHHIVATPEALRLDRTTVSIDVATALELAEHALRRDASWSELEAAEAACAGDVLADDPYGVSAVALHEECRSSRLAVLRRMVDTAAGDGRTDDAVRAAMRLLRTDPYDEACHLQLVVLCARARRHGEARRHYRTYVQRMAELEVEPEPFPSTGSAATLRP